MTIRIIHPGMITTIQDLGRFGSQRYGVIVSGAMDSISLRIANFLVGNDENEGAFECTVLGPTIHFEHEHVIAITGGDFAPTINNNVVPMWRPILVRSGDVLKLKAAHTGCRAYIAVAGGFNVPLFLNSKSTYLKASIGGFHGRVLKQGDVLVTECRTVDNELMLQQLKDHPQAFRWYVNYSSFFNFKNEQTLRVIHGSEYIKFTERSKEHFTNNVYTITTEADRMGYRLSGTPLQLTEEFQLLSESVTYGTVQIPPNGQPIILMADRQTTGGYPKIAQVITADLPKLAQMQPHHSIRFNCVTLEEAEQALVEQESSIAMVKYAIQSKHPQ